MRRLILIALAVALAAVVAMPSTLFAQEADDFESTISGMQAAFNAGDVDAALAFFAEDAVVEMMPSEVGLPGAPFEGHDEIREWLEMEIAANAQMEMTVQEVEDNRVMASHTLTSDMLTQMGIETLQASDELVFEDGLLARQIITVSEESVADILAAYEQQEEPSESQAGFSNASADGHYGVVMTAGPSVAAGVGTCDLDGMGNYSCTININLPTEDGGRQQVASTEQGTFNVNSDGASIANGTRSFPDGTEMEVSYDCVTTEAEQSGSGLLITDFHCVQHEAMGPIGALSEATMSRLPAVQTGEMAARTPEQTFQDHLQAFGTGDVDEILADFAEDAIVINESGVLRGHEEIRGLFEQMVSAFPPGSTIEIQEQVIDGNVVYFTWTGESEQFVVPFATDTLIIRDGLIQTQTLAAQMEEKN